VWVAVIAGFAEMVSSAVSDVNFSSNFPTLRDPVTIVAPLGTAYNAAGGIQSLLLLPAVVSLIVRFRRSGQEPRHGTGRPADGGEQRRRARAHLGVDRRARTAAG
jgi:hypothetical protein